MTPEEGLAAVAVSFARALRDAGIRADETRTRTFGRALGVVGMRDRGQLYWAARSTLCSQPDDAAVFDHVFAAFFNATLPMERRTNRRPAVDLPVWLVPGDEADDAGAGPPVGDESDQRHGLVAWSRRESLRHKDFSTFSEEDREHVKGLLRGLRLDEERRPSRRLEPARRGALDLRRTVRTALRSGGEIMALPRHRGSQRPRRVVLLCDVSGSMAPYADGLLAFMHATASRSNIVEAFCFGTRLTRVTRELRTHGPPLAIARARQAVPDWGGGTRIGEAVRDFNRSWGAPGLARGAVVVILSDGWDRSDPAVMAWEMRRLRRLARLVIWVNPLKADPGYEPLTRALVAALPHVDRLVEGHSIAALEHLAQLIRPRRTPPLQRRPSRAPHR